LKEEGRESGFESTTRKKVIKLSRENLIPKNPRGIYLSVRRSPAIYEYPTPTPGI
jgi:hypothetical protein